MLQLLVWFPAVLLRFARSAETSSDPISETSPVVPVTIPDTGTAADTFFAVAEERIAMLRKRDGTEMYEVVVVPCSPTRSEPSAMNVEVAESVGKNVETG